MTKYIRTVMNRNNYDFPFVYDVVNYAVSDLDGPNIMNESPWKKVNDYACKAFKAARAANPTAKLFYSDKGHASMVGS